MARVLYKPLGLLVGVLGGVIAGALFKRVWKAVAHEDEAPEAKDICAECPVREPCLEYALTVREKHGVWGGRTERERRRLIRQRRRSA